MQDENVSSLCSFSELCGEGSGEASTSELCGEASGKLLRQGSVQKPLNLCRQAPLSNLPRSFQEALYDGHKAKAIKRHLKVFTNASARGARPGATSRVLAHGISRPYFFKVNNPSIRIRELLSTTKGNTAASFEAKKSGTDKFINWRRFFEKILKN